MISKRFSKRILFVILLCFGVVILTVGVYASTLNKQTPVRSSKKAVSHGLVLEIDKPVYKRGEKVTITLTNKRDKTVGVSSPIPFVVRDQEGNAVAPFAVITMAVYLSPGESLTWVWDQHNHHEPSNPLVPLGIYTVEIPENAIGPRDLDLSVSLKIVGPPDS